MGAGLSRSCECPLSHIAGFLIDPDSDVVAIVTASAGKVYRRDREHIFQPPSAVSTRTIPAGSLQLRRRNDRRPSAVSNLDEVDFVIVGSGAAGGFCEKSFRRMVFRVVVSNRARTCTNPDSPRQLKILQERPAHQSSKNFSQTHFEKTPDDKAKPSARSSTAAPSRHEHHFHRDFWRFSRD